MNKPGRRPAGLARVLALFLAAAPFSALSSDPGENSLDILVFGASGKVGRHVVPEALQRGHRVTAVSRNPDSIKTPNEDPGKNTRQNLEVVQGDILDMDSVLHLVSGKDVVVISVRGVVGEGKTPSDTVVLQGLENVVNALRTLSPQAPRLLHVGGSGSLEVKPGVLFADRIPKLAIPKSLELEIAAQVETLNYLRSVDDVEWTYLTPPKNFTNGKRTGQYRVGGDRVFEDKYGRSRVSRADFAVALVDEAESRAHPQQRISIAY